MILILSWVTSDLVEHLLHPRDLWDVIMSVVVAVFIAVMVAVVPLNRAQHGKFCAVMDGVAFCDDICDVGAGQETVVFSGAVVNWTCVEPHWALTLVRVVSNVDCLGEQPSKVRLVGGKCNPPPVIHRVRKCPFSCSIVPFFQFQGFNSSFQ